MNRPKTVQLIMDIFEFQGLGTQMRPKDAHAILDALIFNGVAQIEKEPLDVDDLLIHPTQTALTPSQLAILKDYPERIGLTRDWAEAILGTIKAAFEEKR